MILFILYSVKLTKPLNMINRSFLTGLFLFTFMNYQLAQCVSDETHVISFEVDAVTYEIVKENLNWQNAAACAVERGGFLVEINDYDEQVAVYNQLLNSDIDVTKTVAPDGGLASYVWTGGNDRANEGIWIWDGDNDGEGTQFWEGDASGYPLEFSNWGNEPDNYNNQDGCGLALTNWPFGSAGQWNDVRDINTLYFVIEFPDESSNNDRLLPEQVMIYPNPASDYLFIDIPQDQSDHELVLWNILGKRIQKNTCGPGKNKISLEKIPHGIYFLHLQSAGKTQTKRLLIQ
jgi:hypothetical protein